MPRTLELWGHNRRRNFNSEKDLREGGLFYIRLAWVFLETSINEFIAGLPRVDRDGVPRGIEEKMLVKHRKCNGSEWQTK